MKSTVQNNFIESIDFESAEELFQFILPWNNEKLQQYVFRGHSSECYKLVPTALRIEDNDSLWAKSRLDKPFNDYWKYETFQVQVEKSLLIDFYRLADKQGMVVPNLNRSIENFTLEDDSICFNEIFKYPKWLPVEYYDLAALAQHYGIPTRLLDWTYDIYVALYFALRGALKSKTNIVIWCINRKKIGEEKNCNDKLKIQFITPHYANNPNLNAQKGLFSLWPVDTEKIQMQETKLSNDKYIETNRTPLDELIKNVIDPSDKEIYFKKLHLKYEEVKKGLNYLNILGYNCSTIFPGYKGVADEILFRHEYKKKPNKSFNLTFVLS